MYGMVKYLSSLNTLLLNTCAVDNTRSKKKAASLIGCKFQFNAKMGER